MLGQEGQPDQINGEVTVQVSSSASSIRLQYPITRSCKLPTKVYTLSM